MTGPWYAGHLIRPDAIGQAAAETALFTSWRASEQAEVWDEATADARRRSGRRFDAPAMTPEEVLRGAR